MILTAILVLTGVQAPSRGGPTSLGNGTESQSVQAGPRVGLIDKKTDSQSGRAELAEFPWLVPSCKAQAALIDYLEFKAGKPVACPSFRPEIGALMDWVSSRKPGDLVYSDPGAGYLYLCENLQVAERLLSMPRAAHNRLGLTVADYSLICSIRLKDARLRRDAYEAFVLPYIDLAPTSQKEVRNRAELLQDACAALKAGGDLAEEVSVLRWEMRHTSEHEARDRVEAELAEATAALASADNGALFRGRGLGPETQGRGDDTNPAKPDLTSAAETAESADAHAPSSPSGPFAEIPERDRLRSFAPPVGLAGGTLLYTQYVPSDTGSGGVRMGFVLRTPKDNPRRPDACVIHYVEGNGQLLDPRVLPDGKRVLVKYGEYPDGVKLSPYRYYIYDLVKHTWTPGAPSALTFPRLDVSLDGRFIAAVEGGNIRGDSARYAKPIDLDVFDTVTGQCIVVLKDLNHAPTVAWTNRGTLLFEAEEPPSRDVNGHETGLGPAVRAGRSVLGIFELDPVSGKRELLVRNAYAPVPSPDGRWIAFWGWPDSSEDPGGHVDPDEQGSGCLSPYLYDAGAKRRYVLKNNLLEESDTLVWSPESRRLLALRYSELPVGVSRDCRVLAMDVGSGKNGVPRTAALVGTLHAQTAGAFHGSFGGQFRPLRFSQDAKHLILVKTEEKGLDEAHCYDYEDTVEDLNLEMGDVREIARLYDDLGVDWTDVPLPDAAWAPIKSAAN